jgi:hypothetical protein
LGQLTGLLAVSSALGFGMSAYLSAIGVGKAGQLRGLSRELPRPLGLLASLLARQGGHRARL